MGWTLTDTYDPARHSLLKEVDQNGSLTEASYDALGRVTGVWTPDHTRTAFPSTPVTGYAYTVSATAASSVKTTQLTAGATQIVSYQLYDGLLRLRQTQSPAEGGGRDLSDTFYDAAGRVYDANTDWYDTTSPTSTVFDATTTVPSETTTSYDGAGRTSSITSYGDGAQLWQTTYAYGGDHIDTTPPAGTPATTRYTDARGNPSRLLTYHGSAVSGSYDTTSYTYWPAGQLKTMTDTAGNQWSWTYDVLGRLTASSDPDTGDTTNSYDPAGRLTSSTDARGITLDYSYDTLDRKTDEYLDPPTASSKLAHWDYDTAAVTGAPAGTLAKGQPADAIRYSSGTSGPAFTTAVTSYDQANRPTGTSVTIPTGYGPLTGTYTTAMGYAVTGQLTSRTDPPVGGLASETLTLGYDSLGQPGGLDSNLASYLDSVRYDYGRLTSTDQSWSAADLTHTYSWQDGSNRLLEALVQRIASSNAIIADRHYSYDQADDITAINDPTPATGTDSQCFAYDHQQQLTEAWTPASTNCADPRSDTSLGGPAPYWQSYQDDPIGNRLSATRHATDIAHADETDTYTYPVPGTGQPHAVQAISHSDGSPTSTYGYDPAGHTTSRPGGQTLSYDPEGRLTGVSTGGSSSQSDIYDADGTLLLRTDPTGNTTLYLADTQAHLTAGASTASASRTYTAPNGNQVAERTTTAGTTGSKLYFLDTDTNGTITATLDTANNPVRRHYDPYGNPRDPTPPTWIDPNTYLGKPPTPPPPPSTSAPATTTPPPAASSPPTRSSTPPTHPRTTATATPTTTPPPAATPPDCDRPTTPGRSPDPTCRPGSTPRT